MDTLTDNEVRTLLESQRDWLRKHASGYTRDPETALDWCQEGYIVMWEAVKSFNGQGSMQGWMRQNVRWKFTHLHKIRQRDERTKAVDSESPMWDDFHSPESMDRVLSGYHNGEIAEAIESLSPTQREYVYRRFWLGQPQPEICQAMGIHNPMHLWSRPKYGAKPKLAEKLAHLAEV